MSEGGIYLQRFHAGVLLGFDDRLGGVGWVKTPPLPKIEGGGGPDQPHLEMSDQSLGTTEAESRGVF
jgi:hypothetical protein